MYALIGCGKCGCSLLGTFMQVQRKFARYLYHPIAVSSTVDDLVRSGTNPDNWLGIMRTGDLVIGREKGFGQKITGGLGKDFNRGNSIFSNEEDWLVDYFEEMLPSYGSREEKEEINFVLLFFGLGGGTGGGGAPVIGKVFKNRGIPVIGIGVLPAESEGYGWAWNAYQSFNEVLGSLDGFMVADNNLIDRPGGLGTLYASFNRYIVGCVADFIFGGVGAGPRVKHGGMASLDYVDLISSLTLGNDKKGVGILGRSTVNMGYFGGLKDFEHGKWLRNALSQLTLDMEIGDNLKKLAGVGTIHGSLKKGFPFYELEEDLRDITYMKQAYVGFNETKERLAKLTLSLTYDPNDIPRLWRLRDRAEKYIETSGEKQIRLPEDRLFENA